MKLKNFFSTKSQTSTGFSTGFGNLLGFSAIRRETVSPQDYLRISKESPHLIAKSKFIAARPGKKGFGAFEVVYSSPILKRQNKE
jgi:hypothetical protein